MVGFPRGLSPWLGGGLLVTCLYGLSLCVCKHVPGVSVCRKLLQEHQYSWIRAHPDALILTRLPLQRPHLQMQSHSEVLGVRTSTYQFARDTTEPIRGPTKTY